MVDGSRRNIVRRIKQKEIDWRNLKEYSKSIYNIYRVFSSLVRIKERKIDKTEFYLIEDGIIFHYTIKYQIMIFL